MTKTIRELQADAAYLRSLLGGLDALHSMCPYIPPGADVETRRAANARPVLIEDAIRRAEALERDLDAFVPGSEGEQKAAAVATAK